MRWRVEHKAGGAQADRVLDHLESRAYVTTDAYECAGTTRRVDDCRRHAENFGMSQAGILRCVATGDDEFNIGIGHPPDNLRQFVEVDRALVVKRRYGNRADSR